MSKILTGMLAAAGLTLALAGCTGRDDDAAANAAAADANAVAMNEPAVEAPANDVAANDMNGADNAADQGSTDH